MDGNKVYQIKDRFKRKRVEFSIKYDSKVDGNWMDKKQAEFKDAYIKNFKPASEKLMNKHGQIADLFDSWINRLEPK